MADLGMTSRNEGCVRRRQAWDGYSSWWRWEIIFVWSSTGSARRDGGGFCSGGSDGGFILEREVGWERASFFFFLDCKEGLSQRDFWRKVVCKDTGPVLFRGG